MEPIYANELPRNTGLLNLVKSKYTSVPTPAPNSAADMDIFTATFYSSKLLLMIIGTAIVAARIASNCCSANRISCTALGLSLTP